MCKLSLLVLTLSIVALGFFTTMITYDVTPKFEYTKDKWNTTCRFGRDDRKPLFVQKLDGTTDFSVSEEKCKDYAADKWGVNRLGNGFLGDTAKGFKQCIFKYKSATKITPAFTQNDLECKIQPDTKSCMQVCKDNMLAYSSYVIDVRTEGFMYCKCANTLVSETSVNLTSTGIFKVDNRVTDLPGNLEFTAQECYDYAKTLTTYFIQKVTPPDLSLDESECREYAKSIGDSGFWIVANTNDGNHADTNPTGCQLWTSSTPGSVLNTVRYNPKENNNDCNRNWIVGCVQKYREFTSGNPDVNVTREECESYATRLKIQGYTTITKADRPRGCHRNGVGGEINYNLSPESTVQCSTSMSCVHKIHKTKYFHQDDDINKPRRSEYQSLNNLPTGCIKLPNNAEYPYMMYNTHENSINCGSGTEWCYQMYKGDTKGCYLDTATDKVFYSRAGNGCSQTRVCIVEELTGFDSRLVHCGNCGNCSTVLDARVMINTSNTLTDKLKECSVYSIAGGELKKCISERIGFTNACSYCFEKNIECTKKHCEFVCGYETVLDIDVSNKDGEISKCILCDEHYCGEEFKKCAGMTRRRAGLVSSIERDLDEICQYNILKEMRDKNY